MKGVTENEKVVGASELEVLKSEKYRRWWSAGRKCEVSVSVTVHFLVMQ